MVKLIKEIDIIKQKRQIIQLLKSTNRHGINNLIRFMEGSDYFTAPASARYHNNFKGGLANHSMNVYRLFHRMVLEFNAEIPLDSIILVSFLHDLCKVYAYTEKENGGYAKVEGSKGHATLSIERISKYITLDSVEREIISYHMGFYGSKSFNHFEFEYTLKDLGSVYNSNKMAKLFYFCDDMVSQFMESTLKKADREAMK